MRSLKEITFHRLLFGGDQLTAKRARAGIRIRNNSTNSADRLEGLLPVAEDWHAKVVFLEVRSRLTVVLNFKIHFNNISQLEEIVQVNISFRCWNYLSVTKCYQS